MGLSKERKCDIKSIVTQKEWDINAKKSGDEYRSFSKQIDNFLDYLDDDSTMLYWMPIHEMRNEEIALIICNFLKRREEDKHSRLLLNNLDYEGLKYDYYHFMATTKETSESSIYLKEKARRFSKKKNFPFDLYGNKEDINTIWESNTDIVEKIDSTQRYIKRIVFLFLAKKEVIKMLGTNTHNPKNKEVFIDLICYTAKLFLDKLLLSNDNVPDKIRRLNSILHGLKEVRSSVEKDIFEIREEFKKNRVENPPKCNDDMISRYFVLYMQRRALYREIENISSLIKDDFPNFDLPDLKEITERRVSQCSTQKLKKILLPQPIKGERDFSNKVSFVQKFIQFYLENGETKCDDIRYVQILFTVIYFSNVSYRKEKVPTIVRNMLRDKTKQKISSTRYLFMSMKIEQVLFLKAGLRDEYPVYREIVDTLNRLLLLPYSTLNDEKIYRQIYRIWRNFSDLL